MPACDVSVIVWTRNNAPLVTKCLAYLEEQTHPAGHYEVVVVDDGSDPENYARIERYAAGAPMRVKALRTDGGGAARARNVALNVATGRYVLFLDEELLAGPWLIERHLSVQAAHGGEVATVGSVQRHPEMEHRTLTRWYLPEETPPLVSRETPVSFLDWRAHNLCLPREAVLEAGGFDEAFLLPFFDDTDLASRLEAGGMRGIYVPDARAYVWRTSSFSLERRRHYAKGYSLYTLRARTGSPAIYTRYRVARNPLFNLFDALAMPLYTRLCERLNTDPRRFGYLYKRVLRYDLYRGYDDARRSRPPRDQFRGARLPVRAPV